MKQVEKFDAMVVRTTRMLNHAERTKIELRKRIMVLQKELTETQENLQGFYEADAEEISGLKATIVAKNVKIDELELAASVPKDICQKYGKCGMALKDSATLTLHMKSAHGQKQGKKCNKCPQVFGSEKLLRKHINDKHSTWEYQCEICKDKFSTMNDAREHSMKSCGNIKQKEVVIDIEDVENDHRCNACLISYSSNKHLKKHMEEHHATDCTKCHAIFKSQDDIYKHANVCSEIRAPLMCEKCNCELISKTGLEKHMERCNGEELPTINKKPMQQQSKEKCTNGPKCKFLRENRCLFVHKEHQNSKHIEKEHRRILEIRCQNCRKNIFKPQRKTLA